MSHPTAEIICHCFNHSRADIERDYLQNGRSRILEKIIEAKRLGACQCAIKNPKGS
jgi:hypothetical protein